MSFIELRFFIFVGFLFLIYYVLPKKVQWIVLLAASIFFYGTYGWEKLPFIVVSALIAWLAARHMASIYQQVEDKAAAKKRSKRILLLSVTALIGLLVYAKIGTWVMQSVGTALQIGGAETVKAIVALGVSYYTFSLIAYMADGL